MEKSALLRTPVEIWRNIFDFALQWLELPAKDDAPLKYINFDWNSCNRYNLYSSTLYDRRKLRLVCRSWREVIDAGYTPLSIRISQEEQRPRVEAYSILNRPLIIFNAGECICMRQALCTCPQGLSPTPKCNAERNLYDCKMGISPLEENIIQFFPNNAQETRFASQEDILQINTFQTKLLLIHGIYDADWGQFSSLLKYAKNVQILGWGPPNSPSNIRSLGQLTKLTMLYLCLQVDHEEWTNRALTLPALRHLRILFLGDYKSGKLTQEKCLEESMVNWNFVNLSIIEAYGSIRPTMQRNLTSLVSRHCDTINALVFKLIDNLNGNWYGESTLWKSLSHLSLVGVSLSSFAISQISQLPIPVTPYGITLILFISEVLDTIGTVSKALEYAGLLVNWCKSLPCDTKLISINGSWRDMKIWIETRSNLFRNNTLQAVKAFLEEMVKSGIPFCDRDGSFLHSSDLNSLLTD